VIATGAPRLVGLALDDLTLEVDALNTPAASLSVERNWSRRSRMSLEELEASEPVRAALRRVRLNAAKARAV